MSHDQNAADQRIDHVEKQSQFHLFLADDSCERISFLVWFRHGLDSLPDFVSMPQKAQMAQNLEIIVQESGEASFDGCDVVRSLQAQIDRTAQVCRHFGVAFTNDETALGPF